MARDAPEPLDARLRQALAEHRHKAKIDADLAVAAQATIGGAQRYAAFKQVIGRAIDAKKLRVAVRSSLLRRLSDGGFRVVERSTRFNHGVAATRIARLVPGELEPTRVYGLRWSGGAR